MSRQEALILNMDDVHVKRQLMSKIGALSGVWKMTLTRQRFRRTLDQNAYYWVAVVTPFVEWLEDEWGDKIEPEQAHEMLKQRILGVKYKEIAGQPLAIPPSSRNLDIEEFSIYVEKCIQWLAEFCGIVVVPSDVYSTQPNQTRKD
jgi:hypothetical protein